LTQVISDRHVSDRCWKGFQGQRSKVKAEARPNAHLRRRHTFRWCDVEVLDILEILDIYAQNALEVAQQIYETY